MNAPQEAQIRKAKDRLNAAAVRCLCGDRGASAEADAAMAEVNQLRRKTVAEGLPNPFQTNKTIKEKS